jgi:hypothetical protein
MIKVCYGMIVTRSLVLYACFVDRCLSFCTFFFWPLCCLFYFDIRILIVPLVSSNSSSTRNMTANSWWRPQFFTFWNPACQIKKVVVLFVNIMIIGTCSMTGDMYFIHTCTWISNVICMVLFVFSEVRWEVIVNFVDFGGIGGYHSLNFLYLITNGECTMREAINTLCHILEIFIYPFTLSKVSLNGW